MNGPSRVTATDGWPSHWTILADPATMSAFLILSSAIIWSTAPLLVHLMAQDTHPFYFNSLYQLVNILIAIVFMLVTKHNFFNKSLTTSPGKNFSLLREAFSSPVRLYLFWITIGSFNYALFIWSLEFIETAVSSIIFEIWPIILVYLATSRLVKSRSDISKGETNVTKEHLYLSILAGIGLIFMLSSQQLDSLSSFNFSSDSLIGAILALFAAIGTAFHIHTSLKYGEKLYKHLQEKGYLKDGKETLSQREKETLSRKPILWLVNSGFHYR